MGRGDCAGAAPGVGMLADEGRDWFASLRADAASPVKKLGVV